MEPLIKLNDNIIDINLTKKPLLCLDVKDATN